MVRYWQRVFSATMKVAKHIFETPEGKHPLIYEDDTSDRVATVKTKGGLHQQIWSI